MRFFHVYLYPDFYPGFFKDLLRVKGINLQPNLTYE